MSSSPRLCHGGTLSRTSPSCRLQTHAPNRSICVIYHHYDNAMIAVKPAHSNDGPAINQCTSLPFTQRDIDLFTEFLREFTGGGFLSLLDEKKKTQLSRDFTGEDFVCQESSSRCDAGSIAVGGRAPVFFSDGLKRTEASALYSSDCQTRARFARDERDFFNNSCAVQSVRMSGANDKQGTVQHAASEMDSPRTTTQSRSTDRCAHSSCVPSDDAIKPTRSTADRIFLHRDPSLPNMVLSYSTVRTLTNKTYVRRLQLSREDTVRLFPKVQGVLQFAFTKDMKHSSSFPYKRDISVLIQDAKGRKWPIVLECLRAAGQRHIRLNRGWPDMCRANGLSFGKQFRLDRWVSVPSSSSTLRHDDIVTLSPL